MRFLLGCAFALITQQAVAQEAPGSCRYPFAGPARGLVKFVIREGFQYTSTAAVEAKFRSKEFQTYFFDPAKRFNYDSIFHRCFAHLRDSLGTDVLCERVFLYPNSFGISSDGTEFKLEVAFSYPLLRETPTAMTNPMASRYETTNIVYYYRRTPNGKVTIAYPQNLLNCHNRADCGITVTRAQALAMLRQRGLLRPNDKVRLDVAGRSWQVTLSEDDWLSRHLTIDLQTGAFSAVTEMRRID